MNNGKTSYRRLVWAIMIGFTMMSVALLTPALVLLSVKIINLDPKGYTATYGFATAIGTFFAIIAPPLGGALGDHTHLMFGKRRVWLLVGAVVGAIGMLMMGFSKSIGVLIAGWMIVQFFYNIAGASFSSLVPDQVPEAKRASFSGIIGLAQPMGILIGNLLAGALNIKAPMLLWIILTIFGLVGPMITALLIKDMPAARREKTAKGSVLDTLKHIYPSPRKYPNYTKAFLLKVLILMGYGAGTYVPIMLARKFGYTGNQAGQIVAMVNIIGLLFAAGMSLVGGILSDKTKRQRPFILAGGLSIIVGLFFDMFATGIPMIIIGGILTAAGFGLFNSSDASLVLRVLPNKEDAGKDFGLMTSANNFQGILVPLLAPLLLGIGNLSKGNWIFFFGGMAALTALGIVVLYRIPEDPRFAAAQAEKTIHHDDSHSDTPSAHVM